MPEVSEAAREWACVDNTSVAVLETFIAPTRRKSRGRLARARIDELKKQQVAIATPPPSVKPTPARPTEPPASNAPAPAPTRCDGVDVEVVSGRFFLSRCLTPGSGEVFKDCPECPEMVVVPAGEFLMGSPDSENGRDTDEGPRHRVTFSRPFAVGKFAVTFADWDACVAKGGCNGYRPSDKDWGRSNRPVININWDDAKAYVNWLSKATAKPYRLLSESEREYVTRGGTTTPFWWGSLMASEANHAGAVPYPPGNSNSQTRLQPAQRTLPVDSFKPNPWGLYQVHGNVSEWMEDCWNNSYRGAPSDGSAWISGDCSRRVLRGGSWSDNGAKLRSADRDTQASIFRSTALGFRVARTLSP